MTKRFAKDFAVDLVYMQINNDRVFDLLLIIFSISVQAILLKLRYLYTVTLSLVDTFLKKCVILIIWRMSITL